VSYDPDQYYAVMHALLQADRAGRLRREVLARSEERLKRVAGQGVAMLGAPMAP